ncbi:zf-RVT domain-containing protein [Cephalotus follicularis]|uniref:Zf-RVT domain-containing protein n=1 Tax=Cephalotus follicularis TaxID=3775 RepID=A0A1Q3DK35_CEPFO|nr:zf-RVT domain-containing protein [Cephalotus follicularis]
MARANSWVSRTLSFAGRLQLINATLASMHVFWCSVFLLPMKVVKECNCILRNFLWGGQGRNKVNWVDVCKPQKEGGLGVKYLKMWNKALLLKQIWNLLHNQSLWSKWCLSHLVKNSNFGCLPCRGSLSWSWRQILHLRPVAKEHLVYQCGRGDMFSLWFDPWLHGESVHALYGHRVIYDAGLRPSALVNEVISEGRWHWPQNSCELMEIQGRVQDIRISNSSDCIYWDTPGQIFSTHKAWNGIRGPSCEVPWHSLVWHPTRIPKHSFCLWLAIKGAHRTKDKLRARGSSVSADCSFNYGEEETLDHIFFKCPFSHFVWTAVLAMCNLVRPTLPWSQEVAWMTQHSYGHGFPALVRKLAFVATVYNLWMERNRRCF